MSRFRSLRRKPLAVLVQFSLPAMLAVTLGHAATCTVNSNTDDPADATAKVTAVPPGAWSGANASTVTLRDCIVAANLMTGASGAPTNPGMSIDLSAIAGGTIALSNTLPLIFNNASIGGSGAAVTIDGAGTHRIFFVSGLPDSSVTSLPTLPDPDGAQAITVGLSNLVLQNAKATGGSGHAGGLGAGAALFVNKNATVSLDRVDLKNNNAQGGNASADNTANLGGGGMGGSAFSKGGGGLGGNASANYAADFGAAGGGIGTDSYKSGNNSYGGNFGGTAIGQISSAQGFAQPAFGGGDGNFGSPTHHYNGSIGGGADRYGAGGFGGGSGTGTGTGGFGGGGGAFAEGGGSGSGGFGGGAGILGSTYSYQTNQPGTAGSPGQSGGFGAGGGGGGAGGGCYVDASGPLGGQTGGPGGLGGAGGVGGGIGTPGTDGSNCAFGAPRSSNGVKGTGGGGGGLGGAAFVRTGGTLIVQQSSGAGSVSGNTVAAGSGGSGGDGAAAGAGAFLMSGASTTFDVSANSTYTVSNNIQDDSFASLPTGGSYTAGTGGGAAITKQGTGTLILDAGTIDTYAGFTTINAGTLQLDGLITVSPLIVNSGGTLGGTGNTLAGVTLNSGGAVAPGDSPGTLGAGSLTWNGDSGGNAQMNFELGPTGSGDSDELDISQAFGKGSAGTFKFHFTDGAGGPPTPGKVYTLVRYTSTTFALDASDFSFDYSGTLVGSLQGTFALSGSASPPPAPFVTAPQAALPPNTLTFAVAPQSPTFTKSFAPSSGGPSIKPTLTFTITNTNGVPLTGLAFSDTFPAGLVVAPTPNASNACGGTFTANAGAGTVSLSGGSVGANASCTLAVTVQAPPGSYDNTTGPISSTETGQGGTAAASLTVAATPVTLQSFEVD